jgi:hypothetical protein
MQTLNLLSLAAMCMFPNLEDAQTLQKEFQAPPPQILEVREKGKIINIKEPGTLKITPDGIYFTPASTQKPPQVVTTSSVAHCPQCIIVRPPVVYTYSSGCHSGGCVIYSGCSPCHQGCSSGCGHGRSRGGRCGRCR